MNEPTEVHRVVRGMEYQMAVSASRHNGRWRRSFGTSGVMVGSMVRGIAMEGVHVGVYQRRRRRDKTAIVGVVVSSTLIRLTCSMDGGGVG